MLGDPRYRTETPLGQRMHPSLSFATKNLSCCHQKTTTKNLTSSTENTDNCENNTYSCQFENRELFVRLQFSNLEVSRLRSLLVDKDFWYNNVLEAVKADQDSLIATNKRLSMERDQLRRRVIGAEERVRRLEAKLSGRTDSSSCNKSDNCRSDLK